MLKSLNLKMTKFRKCKIPINDFINVSYLQMKKHHCTLYISLTKAGSPAHPAL